MPDVFSAPPSPDIGTTPPPPPPPPVIPPPPTPAVELPPQPRRSFPKGVIFAILLLLVVGLGAFLISRFSSINPFPGQTTIVYWGLWEPDKVIRPILDEFEASHPKIKVTYIKQSPQDYRERLQSALSQGKGPDVFRIHNTWTPMFKTFLAPVPASIYSPADYQTIFYPTAAKDLVVGSNFVAVPLMIDGLAMYINKDLLGQTGLPVPANWDDLRTAALAMSQCESQSGACLGDSRVLVSGLAMGTTDNVDHWQDIIAVLMLQNNVNLSQPNVPVSKPAEDVVDFYTSFNKRYQIWNSNLPNSTTMFINGKLGILFAPSWRVFEILAVKPNLNFAVYPIPQVPLDPTRNEKPIAWASFWAEAVNSKSRISSSAWELVKFMSSPETLDKMYQLAVSSPDPRQFGEPYSRTDMADKIKDDPFVGAYIRQASFAKSWYMASNTFDGPSGINSRLSDTFAEVINRGKTINSLAEDVNKILSQYGIVPPTP